MALLTLAVMALAVAPLHNAGSPGASSVTAVSALKHRTSGRHRRERKASHHHINFYCHTDYHRIIGPIMYTCSEWVDKDSGVVCLQIVFTVSLISGG